MGAKGHHSDPMYPYIAPLLPSPPSVYIVLCPEHHQSPQSRHLYQSAAWHLSSRRHGNTSFRPTLPPTRAFRAASVLRQSDQILLSKAYRVAAPLPLLLSPNHHGCRPGLCWPTPGATKGLLPLRPTVARGSNLMGGGARRKKPNWGRGRGRTRT